MNDGGPAFPLATSLVTYDKPEGTTFFAEGMSLRDWFAGMAICQIVKDRYNLVPGELEAYAECAYKVADAMLKERAK